MFYAFLIIFGGIMVFVIASTRRSGPGHEGRDEPAPWLKKLPLLPFVIFAGIGLVLSIVVHVFSLFGVALPLKDAVFLLHMGIFVIWLPVVALNQGKRKGNDFFSRGPKWAQRLLTVIFVYAIANFIYFAATQPPRSSRKSGSSNPAPPGVLRGFSGHWILFYSAGFMVLWNARSERRAIPPVRPPIQLEQL
jgi:hypothetical protein